MALGTSSSLSRSRPAVTGSVAALSCRSTSMIASLAAGTIPSHADCRQHSARSVCSCVVVGVVPLEVGERDQVAARRRRAR